jgi:MFS family permease
MSRWFKGLWRQPDFLKLWGGQTFSAFGSLVSKLALPFLVIFALHASPTQVSWVRTAEIVPGMLAGLFAGVWIDRLRRRPIMIWADLGRALLLGSIPLAYWLGHLTLIQIIVVAAFVSVLTVAFDVAYDAYLPTLVEPEQVMEANAKLSATGSVAEVSGFGIAGALYQLIGGPLTILIDATSFVVSAVTLSWLRTPEVDAVAPEGHEPMLHEARAGLKVLTANPTLIRLASVSGLGNLYGGFMGTIYVLYISRGLQIAPGVQGVLYAMGGISSFFGAVVAGRVLHRFGLSKTLLITNLLGLMGIALVPLAGGPLWLILACLVAQQFLGDGPETIYNIHVTSLRQTLTPNRFLGRVNATWQVSNWTMMLVGTLASGLLAEAIGLRTTFFIAIAIRALQLPLLYLSRVGAHTRQS